MQLSNNIEIKDLGFLFFVYSSKYSENSLFPLKSEGLVPEILDESLDNLIGKSVNLFLGLSKFLEK